ncbi:hypothetical protein [Nitrosomonas sp. Nm84]
MQIKFSIDKLSATFFELATGVSFSIHLYKAA